MTTNTTSTASQAPEVLTKQVATWRAEVARLNDLIAHATGASQEPAVSIEKDEEFLNLLTRWTKHQDNTNADIMAGHIKWTELIAHIDAKLAQAREEGFEEMRKVIAENAVLMADACRRATAAEAKLDRIKAMWVDMQDPFKKQASMSVYSTGWERCHKEFGALLQPQPQADESGLPG